MWKNVSIIKLKKSENDQNNLIMIEQKISELNVIPIIAHHLYSLENYQFTGSRSHDIMSWQTITANR